MFRTLDLILSTLGSVPSNVFTVDLGTFDGTDPKVDSVKPKVQNTIFFPCGYYATSITCPCNTNTSWNYYCQMVTTRSRPVR